MNKPYLSSYFRGRGLIGSSQIQETNNQEEIIDYDLIREFFLEFDVQCNHINDLSKSIQQQESLEKILKTIKQIQCYSQFFKQASRNNQKTKEYIKQILKNLEALLDSFINTISPRLSHYKSQQFVITFHDQYFYIMLMIIYLQIQKDNYQYELFLIKTCLEICPTNSEKSKEVLLTIISNISLEELSTDFLTALAQGGLYLYKDIKKRKQTNMFKIIFYFFIWDLEQYCSVINSNHHHWTKKQIQCDTMTRLSSITDISDVMEAKNQKLVNQYNMQMTYKQLIASIPIELLKLFCTQTYQVQILQGYSVSQYKLLTKHQTLNKQKLLKILNILPIIKICILLKNLVCSQPKQRINNFFQKIHFQ